MDRARALSWRAEATDSREDTSLSLSLSSVFCSFILLIRTTDNRKQKSREVGRGWRGEAKAGRGGDQKGKFFFLTSGGCRWSVGLYRRRRRTPHVFSRAIDSCCSTGAPLRRVRRCAVSGARLTARLSSGVVMDTCNRSPSTGRRWWVRFDDGRIFIKMRAHFIKKAFRGAFPVHALKTMTYESTSGDKPCSERGPSYPPD